MITPDPIFHAPPIGRGRYGLQLSRRILFEVIYGLETGSPEWQFEFWEEEEVTGGQIWRIRWVVDGNYRVFGLKLVNYPSSMRWRVVVMQNPRIVLPQIWPFTTDGIAQTPQNGQIIFFIDRLTFWNVFEVHDTEIISITFTFDRLLRVFFGFGSFSKRHSDDCWFVKVSYS